MSALTREEYEAPSTTGLSPYGYDGIDRGWTRYVDSEPMFGRSTRGTIWHAVLQSNYLRPDGTLSNVCTRRTVCGASRHSVVSRSIEPFNVAGRKHAPEATVCAKCARILASAAPSSSTTTEARQK